MALLSTQSCEGCGAALPEGADVCDLCGTAVAEATAPDELTSEVSVVDTEPPAGVAAGGAFCNQCGWQSPPGARFCSMCGARLQDQAVAARPVAPLADLPSPRQTASAQAGPGAPAPERSQGDVKRQAALIIGAGLLIVVVLYVVSALSSDLRANTGAPASAASAAQSPAPIEQEALPPQIEEQAAALEAEIEAATGEARIEKRRELIGLFLGAGRFDRAALVQEEMARAEDTPEAWRRAGDLLYDWMVAVQDASRAQVAARAVAAYERVLEDQPANLDVRTDMATAYLYSNTPMKAVEEVKKVLDTDPAHVQANFNYGHMLMLINSLEKAEEQFEKVKTLVAAGSPQYREAEARLEAIRQLRQEQDS